MECFLQHTWRMRDQFSTLARKAADALGSPWAFFGGILLVLGWVVSGPYFRYSDTWQLVINTGTTIATFLMIFLLQNSQNRDARVVNLKLDELIRALGPARTELVGMDKLSEADLDRLQKEFASLSEHASRGLERITNVREGRKKNAKNAATTNRKSAGTDKDPS